MKVKEFKLVEMSSYSPDQSYRKWYEFQPQYDDKIININLGNTNNGHQRNAEIS